ncbi:hypothetical protein [Variovorax saccharolyticus]|uniref:hypothetical protein n=1 Tax=Variovorax saccharolyticus TaxID=3053516 RepID=UPI002574F1E2|nr:hypothetical protein [Variovorax sp. J31P216]MDM0030418.1 hypothetical protein [Variovorax sp. J31P216]
MCGIEGVKSVPVPSQKEQYKNELKTDTGQPSNSQSSSTNDVPIDDFLPSELMRTDSAMNPKFLAKTGPFGPRLSHQFTEVKDPDFELPQLLGPGFDEFFKNGKCYPLKKLSRLYKEEGQREIKTHLGRNMGPFLPRFEELYANRHYLAVDEFKQFIRPEKQTVRNDEIVRGDSTALRMIAKNDGEKAFAHLVGENFADFYDMFATANRKGHPESASLLLSDLQNETVGNNISSVLTETALRVEDCRSKHIKQLQVVAQQSLMDSTLRASTPPKSLSDVQERDETKAKDREAKTGDLQRAYFDQLSKILKTAKEFTG